MDDSVYKLFKLTPMEATPALSEISQIIAKFRTNDPKDEAYTHPLCKNIGSVFKELKSPGNPVSKAGRGSLDLVLYGIPGGLHILCPGYVVTPERNITWAVYAYYSLHARDIFSNFLEWAMAQTMEFLKISKIGVAW